MRAVLTYLLAGAAAYLVILITSPLAQWLELRLFYSSMLSTETLGLFSTRRLAGQVFGLNYHEPPPVIGFLMGTATSGLAYAPALLLAGLIIRRLVGQRSEASTFCGHCRAELSDLKEPRCPSCGTAI